MEDAKQTKWIDGMLSTTDWKEGMLTHLAVNEPDLYKLVATKKNFKLRGGLTTLQMLVLT
eukprot:10136227-Ditylum_brightwellii.AAC.1